MPVHSHDIQVIASDFGFASVLGDNNLDIMLIPGYNYNIYIYIYATGSRQIKMATRRKEDFMHVRHVQFARLWHQHLQNLPLLVCFIPLDRKALSSSNCYHHIDS